MKSKSLFLLLSVLFTVLTMTGCGGGGGGTNPVSPQAIGPTANLSGLVSMDGSPLPNTKVYLYKSNQAHLAGISQLASIKNSMLAQTLGADGSYSTLSDSAGRYIFTNVPVGEYTLIAVKDAQHQFAMPNVILGQITEVNAQLTPTASVNGRIVNGSSATPAPVPGALVYLEGTSYVALTDSLGQFAISHIPASQTFRLQVISAQGVLSSTISVSLSPAESKALGDITINPVVTPGATTNTISGSVKFTGFNPPKTDASGVIVILTGQNNQNPSITTTNASGAYSFVVSASGTYNVSVVPNEFTINPIYQTVTTTLSAPVTVADFTLSPPVSNVEENYFVYGQISKTTRIYDDTDEGGVFITLQAQNPPINQAFTQVSRPDGSFAFKVPAGTYTVAIDGSYEIETPFASPLSITAETNIGVISVKPDLTEGAVVTGSVIATTGVSYEVVLTSTSGSNYENIRVTPTATSTFYFYDVMPGTYTLTLNPRIGGYAGTVSSFYVAPGEITRQDITGSFVAPTISTVNVPNNTYIEVIGTNYVAAIDSSSPHTYAAANGIQLAPAFASGTWTTTQVYYDITELQPGTYSLQLTNPNDTKSGQADLFKGMDMPTGIAVEAQDTSVKIIWNNGPFTDRTQISIFDEADVLVSTNNNLPGNIFEVDGLQANATYTVRIANKFGAVVSPEAALTFNTKSSGISNLESFALTNSASIAVNQIFGFEVIGNRYYVAWYVSDLGQVGVSSYNMDGTEGSSTIITSASSATIDHFSMTSGGNQLFVFCPEAEDVGDYSKIVSLDLTLSNQNFQTFDSSISALPSVHVAKLKYYDSKVFYFASQAPGNTYLGYLDPLDPTLSTIENVATFPNGFSSYSGSMVDVVADESENKLFMAIASATSVAATSQGYITIYEYDLSNLSAAPRILTNVLNGVPVDLLRAGSNSLYVCDNVAGYNWAYQRIDRNSGYNYSWTISGVYSDFAVDSHDRIWVYDRGGSGHFYVQLSPNGTPESSFKISQPASVDETGNVNVAEFIKRDSNSVMHFLYRNSTNSISIMRYNDSF